MKATPQSTRPAQAALAQAARPAAGRRARGAPLDVGPAAEPATTRFVESDLGYLLGQAHHTLYQSFERDVGEAGLTLLALSLIHISEPTRPY